MTHPILGGSEGQDSPITYHLEAVVVVGEAVEEAVEKAVEEAGEAVIPEIKMTEDLDKS